MKLKEILEDVNILIHNSIEDSIKIRWINELQKQIYREIPMPDSVYPFVTKPNQQFYELPDDCEGDQISSVIIGGKDYRKVDSIDRNPPCYFWTMYAGSFMISPPQEESSAIVTYKPTPVDFTVEDLDKCPILPADYHQLFVDGCAIRIAKSQGDFSIADRYVESFERLKNKAILDLTHNNVGYVIQPYW